MRSRSLASSLTTARSSPAACRRSSSSANSAKRGSSAAGTTDILRKRGWEGDDDLAALLSATLGEGPVSELRPLPIELDGPSFILEGDGSSGDGRIYLVTGQVWPEFVIDYAEETGEDLGDVHDRERWLYVGCEGSRDGYRDMEDFIAGLEANREIERTFCPRRSEAMEHFVASETSSTAGPRIANASSVSARSASVDERALGSRQPALPQIRQRVRAGRTNLLGSGGGLPLFEPDHRIAKWDTYSLRPTN